MKLLSFETGGRASFGAVKEDGVVDLGARLSYTSLRDLLAQGGLPRAKDCMASASADLALCDIAFLPPIPAPEKIICVGVNYADRNTEYTNLDVPKYPNIFLRTPGSLVGHNRPILRPPESEQLDYEGECAMIIGKAGRRVAEADARSHVAGLTCLNEGTLRDWTRHGTFNVTQGKNFDASGAIGPWLVTIDEAPDFANITVTTRVNGDQRQHDTTAHCVFSFEKLIAYISRWTALAPGDVIATGTPIGAGARFKPPKWLKPGDVVEVEVSGVGTLRNPIADEKA
jgi:2-keto-4-pentenoate hydratase/2-oxohepta-3-ene-1,7-dioic acid hydratase in catechol pathway